MRQLCKLDLYNQIEDTCGVNLRSNNNVTYFCRYHVVFCVKYRKRFLSGIVEKDLKKIVSDVCKERGAELVEQECDGDHIHILVGIHKLIKQIKGRSSFELRAKHPHLNCDRPVRFVPSFNC